MSYRVPGLPLMLQPSVGAILLMELDMGLLSARQVALAESPSCSEYDVFYFIEEVASVKQKWSCFIQAHIVLGMIEPVAYGMIAFLTLTKTQVHQEWLVLLSAAPLAMVELCLQLVSLARFDEKIFKWRLETHNVELFRLLWQKEKDLTFGVFGYRITFGKLRLSIISFILSMLIKKGPRILALLEAYLLNWLEASLEQAVLWAVAGSVQKTGVPSLCTGGSSDLRTFCVCGIFVFFPKSYELRW